MRLLALTTAACLFCVVGLAETAAAPLAKDGRVHACYRVKGKPKGAVRIVRGKRNRCRPGERKISWMKGAKAGAQGASGQPGTSANEAALKSEIAKLAERVDALSVRLEKVEGIVQALCSQVSILTGLLPLAPFECSPL